MYSFFSVFSFRFDFELRIYNSLKSDNSGILLKRDKKEKKDSIPSYIFKHMLLSISYISLKTFLFKNTSNENVLKILSEILIFRNSPPELQNFLSEFLHV